MRSKEKLYGIGVDVVEIKDFKKVMGNRRFLMKIFTARETGYCRRFSSPETRFAARFAAKEATFKALSSGGNGVKTTLDKIEVLNHKNGAPFINIRRKDLKKKFKFFLSLSHSGVEAIAFCIIRKK